MSFSPWFFAVAFGLTLSVLGSEQASSQSQKTDDHAESAENSVKPPDLFAISAHIIEHQEQTVASQRAEQYRRDLSERDLAAQEGMNRATKSIEDATWLMLWVSIANTFLVAIGTALLVWTLRLTRQANKATQDAVDVTREIGRAQVRAYITPVGIRVCPEIINGEPKSFLFQPKFKNTGQSPAVVIKSRLTSCLINGKLPVKSYGNPAEVTHEVGSGGDFFGVGFRISAQTVAQLYNAKSSFYMSSIVEYQDIFYFITGKTYNCAFGANVPITNVILNCTDRFGIDVDFIFAAPIHQNQKQH